MNQKELIDKNRTEKCRFSFPDFKMENGKVTTSHICRNIEVNTFVDNDVCSKCKFYKSRYIEYPITVTSIETDKIEYDSILHSDDIGKPVKIRPCAEEYDGKTYLGIFLGDLPVSSYVSFDEDRAKLDVHHMNNPAIFVPELNKIIFGMESWWGIIKDEKQLKDITDLDIENIWYVKLLDALTKGKE